MSQFSGGTYEHSNGAHTTCCRRSGSAASYAAAGRSSFGSTELVICPRRRQLSLSFMLGKQETRVKSQDFLFWGLFLFLIAAHFRGRFAIGLGRRVTQKNKIGSEY